MNANSFFANKNGTGKTAVHYNSTGATWRSHQARQTVLLFNYEGAQVAGCSTSPQRPDANAAKPALARASATLKLMMPAPTAASSNPLIGIHSRNDHGSNDENTYLTKVDWLLSPGSGWRSATAITTRTRTRRTCSDDADDYPLRLHNVSIEHTYNVSRRC